MYNYPQNKSNKVKQGDYGVRVARYGYDANICRDGELMFNSNWPILQIVKMIGRSDISPYYFGSTKEPVITSAKPYRLVDIRTINTVGVDKSKVYTKIDAYVYEYTDSNSVIHRFYRLGLYGFTHNLGYTPMFFRETDFNWGNTAAGNRIILTGVDIANDVDYPYTSSPMIRSNVYRSDYGIRSKADYAGKFPKTGSNIGVGFDTSIMGKQIMAVKTERSKNSGSPVCVYYPPKDNNKNYFMSGDKFEYYAYVSNMAILSGIEWNIGEVVVVDNDTSDVNIGYGNVYFEWDTTSLPYEASVGGDFRDIEGMMITPPALASLPVDFNKQSLVVVRMPMVSPDVKDVRVS